MSSVPTRYQVSIGSFTRHYSEPQSWSDRTRLLFTRYTVYLHGDFVLWGFRTQLCHPYRETSGVTLPSPKQTYCLCEHIQ